MRKIAVVTGSRAEYGLLQTLMREIDGTPSLQLKVIVTGTHLEPKYGNTVDVIVSDGFDIAERVPLDLNDDDPLSICGAMACGITGMAQALKRLSPDVLVVLGDRYEILAAAQAAMILRIPIAHIHGGESTEGLIDEAIRHAVTKMAHLHFAATEQYARRIKSMGEDPGHVFVTGAPGLDIISTLDRLDRNELEARLQIPLKDQVFLITYHPVTLSQTDPTIPTRELLRALDRYPQASLVFTGVNADPYNDRIFQVLKQYADQNPSRCHIASSLGQLVYLSLMSIADAVIGNSSSGIIEAPALNAPTVNIGDRQKGRLRGASIIDCEEDADAIAAAIDKALDPEFRHAISRAPAAYGKAGASRKICEILATANLDSVLYKRFFDPPGSSEAPAS